MRFQFDPDKAKNNVKKHKVSFADVESVFYDPLAIQIYADAFFEEERWIAIGMGNNNKIYVVVYTIRNNEIRLISARKATKQEVKDYEDGI
jgi:uncharacterized DUF497 family protein